MHVNIQESQNCFQCLFSSVHRFRLLCPKNRHPCLQVMTHLWQPKQFSQRLSEAWVCFIWQRFLKVAIRECLLKMSRNVRHILRPTSNTIIQKRRVKIMWIDTQSDLRGISFSFDDTTNKGQGSSLFSDLSSCLHRHYRRQSCNHMFFGFLSGRQQQNVINIHNTQTKPNFMTIFHNLSTIHTWFQRIRPKAYMFNRKCQKLQPCQWSIT